MYYEKEQKEDGSIHRHYVGGSILISSAGSAPTTITSTKYWHKDHLGSNVAITNAAGAVIERMAYDPFGKRRYTSGAYDQNGTLRSASTDRGFTGHEHLDDLGFIHMNGRIFDPTLGRFLSADPFIQYADNIQSYNRYGYLMNNPLNATDPTGFFKLKTWIGKTASFGGFVGHAQTDMRRFFNVMQVQPGQSRVDGWIASNPLLYSVGQIAVTAIATFFGGPQAGAGAAAAWASYYTYYQTGDIGASIKAGAISYVSAMMFAAAGELTGAMTGFWGGVAQIGAHAVAGCASAMLGGGDCGQGAFSAAVAKGVTVALDAHYTSKGFDKIPFEVGFTSAIVSGGIAAQLGGGKFANGAVTGAFGYLFNYMQTNADGTKTWLPEEPGLERVYPVEEVLLGGKVFSAIGKWIGSVGRTFESLFAGGAKAEVFAARTAPELKEIYGWGNGLDGVKAARDVLNPSVMSRIQSSVSRAEVQAAQKMYQNAVIGGKGGAVAPERAAYMQDILNRWK